jgi:hypothetical protein
MYKPRPQPLFLADKMSKLEGKLLEAMNKLSEKMDLYDKHLTSMGSDLCEVQNQVDLLMHSVQVLQKEQVLLLKSVSEFGKGNHKSGVDDTGVIGPIPSSAATSSSPVAQNLLEGDVRPLVLLLNHAANDNKKP